MDNLVVDQAGALVADASAPFAVGRHDPRMRMVSALEVSGSDAEPAILTQGLGPIGRDRVHVSRMVWAMPD